MHIELTELLRCPERHPDDNYCVLVPEEMAGRHVVQGTVACPVCQRAYPIRDGVAEFDDGAPPAAGASGTLPDPPVVQALLGLASPGGIVVVVGSAARLAQRLAERLDGVHFVGINAPTDVEPLPSLSRLRSSRGIPLRSAVARGVVVGTEHCVESWLAEGARVLLRGLRLVAVAPQVGVTGLKPLAAGQGLWVGAKECRTRQSPPGTSPPPLCA